LSRRSEFEIFNEKKEGKSVNMRLLLLEFESRVNNAMQRGQHYHYRAMVSDSDKPHGGLPTEIPWEKCQTVVETRESLKS
jgi:hypothetical protein